LAAAVRRIDPGKLPTMRAAAQLLHRPGSARDPADVARAVAGIQAQDVYAGPLSFRSRSPSISAARVARARTEERSLLRTWVMRMTIHMISTEDAGWMLPLFEPAMERWERRRLEQLGMPAADVAKSMRVAKRTLERDGPLTRPEMRERIAAAGVKLTNQTGLHVVGLAVTSGLACLGPDRGRSSCLVRRDEWLGKLPRFDREEALAELSRRYLGAFAPASEADFAKWSSLPLRDVRAGLELISPELVESRVGEETLLSLKGQGKRWPPGGALRMLGAFDTYMLGYADRDFALPSEHREAYKAGGGGWLRPIVVRDGVVIGGWSYRRKGDAVEVTLGAPDSLTDADRKAIESEVADIERFEGVPARITRR
jgi:hypothetical protein